jgi:erythritol kinase
MTHPNSVLLCLDSGTTAVKAAAFDRQGRMLCEVQSENRGLRRGGVHVEQDMEITREDAIAVLGACAAKANGVIDGILLTGQGDGLWPIDRDGEPVGPAITWLDGRTRSLIAEPDLQGSLKEIEAVTGSRPTAASQSLHLLWLQRHDPARLRQIQHVLRLKEWLFYSLTDRLQGEPSAALPVWGDWRTGETSRHIEKAIGLERGLELLPDFAPVGACRAALSPRAAAALRLPQNVPVLLGPGDVHVSLIGLGLGTRQGVTRASIFGTSAIHGCHLPDPAAMREKPAGAIIQKFALGSGFLCTHPSFNGATLLQHVRKLAAGVPARIEPSYSELLLHPFFEPGGERAPYTTPHASGAVFGLTAAAKPEQVAWAACEALTFIARKSHEMMSAPAGALSLGGGLAGDPHFARFLATVTGSTVQRTTNGHAGLRGLGAIGAKFLYGEPASTVAANWIGEPDETVQPQEGKIADYADRKFALFSRLVDAVSPFWETMSGVRSTAETLMEARSR